MKSEKIGKRGEKKGKQRKRENTALTKEHDRNQQTATSQTNIRYMVAWCNDK